MRTAALPPTPWLSRVTAAVTALVMPALMLVGALLARHNVKLGRGDRRGAFRTAAAVFLLLMGAWLLGANHVGVLGIEVERCLPRSVSRSSTPHWSGSPISASSLYMRRFSADALIGWQRLIAGSWRDPRVGRDVMIGVAAGLGMTLLFAIHNLIPPLLGHAEPMPVGPEPAVLLSVRYGLAAML